MNKAITFLLLIFFITTENIWGTQQIETVVYPSEDEIAEALSLGEISVEQFFILTELITNRVEPTSFLLEQIPQTLLRIDTINVSAEKPNQIQYFLSKKHKNIPQVTIRNRYSSYLDENGSTRYQSSLNYKKEQFHLNLILKKEYSGRERFTRRYIAFTSTDKQHNVIVGNFSKRFGLGGIIGYRGKLVSYSDELSSESLLFPDYGGFNGLYTQTNFKNNSLTSVISFNRDANLSVFTKALMLNHKNKNLPSIIIGFHELKNRDINEKFNDLKTSLYKKLEYSNGQISTELIAEFNKQQNSSAVLLEGKHKTNKLYLTYALWNYGESFLNISGGSKTSLISEYVEIENMRYEMLSKRSDQTGGLVKSQVRFASNWQVDVASLYSFKNSDTTEMQLFTQLSRKFQTSTKLSVDFLYRNKERIETDSDRPQKKIQSRLMLVYRQDNFYVRNYISFLNKTDEPTYVGYFSEIKHRSDNYGAIHLWLNFSRMNIESNQLDYFYGFLKNEIPMYNSLYLSFKLSHRYNRSATDKHLNQFSIDMSWQI